MRKEEGGGGEEDDQEQTLFIAHTVHTVFCADTHD